MFPSADHLPGTPDYGGGFNSGEPRQSKCCFANNLRQWSHSAFEINAELVDRRRGGTHIRHWKFAPLATLCKAVSKNGRQFPVHQPGGEGPD
jgi:hypothetical protein